MTKATKTIHKIAGKEPIAAALVLGSGLSAIGDLVEDKVTIPYSELKDFPGAGVSGHGRDLVLGFMGGKRVAILTGREHYYEHGNPAAMRTALETMAELGAETLMLTNSAGSLDQRFAPGDLMLIADHINYNGLNPLIGEATDRRFVNMVDCYNADIRGKAKAAAERLGIPLGEGIYFWYSGPSFETPAEIQVAIRFGAQAVGMSTVPEAILGRFLGLKIWACSSITNMGAGLSSENLSHEHTKTMAVQGAAKLQKLIPALVEEL
jgi:purine-nucleoside phosphorylase